MVSVPHSRRRKTRSSSIHSDTATSVFVESTVMSREAPRAKEGRGARHGTTEHEITLSEKRVSQECVLASISRDTSPRATSLQVSEIVSPRSLLRVSRSERFRRSRETGPSGYASRPNSGSARPIRTKSRCSFWCEIPSDSAAGRNPPSVACAMIASATCRSSSKLSGQW